MNLMDAIAGAQNGGTLRSLAGQFGIDEGQAQAAVRQMLPALSSGLKRNVASEGGLAGLLGALDRGNHEQYLERPETLGSSETVQDGNAILGHLLGSKDVSRNVAGAAAKQTGLDSGLLKQMLPVVATMVMGALSKQTAQSNLRGSAASQPSSNLLGMLTPMLDADGDGSVTDDLFNMAKKFF